MVFGKCVVFGNSTDRRAVKALVRLCICAGASETSAVSRKCYKYQNLV